MFRRRADRNRPEQGIAELHALEANLIGTEQQITTRLAQLAEAEWQKALAAYEAQPGQFLTALRYLEHHPVFDSVTPHQNLFRHALSWEVVCIDPAIGGVNETDEARNTHPQVWLECGPTRWRPDCPNDDLWRHLPEYQDTFSEVHDISLDCGGDTFEAAIITLAALVTRRYGHDRSRV